MATTKGKVTTTKSRFISLAKAIYLAERSVVPKWIDAYNEYKRNGGGDKQAFATKWASDVKGTKWDTNTVNTIRINIGLIEWANENIVGGANACLSMAHIVASRGGNNKKADAKPQRKVSTVTISDADVARKLRKAGLSPEVIAIATKAIFTSN
jgi:hypothetical protein